MTWRSGANAKVVLFSEGRFLSLRADDVSQWSSAVAIDTVGTHRDVVCLSQGDERIVLSMSIKLAPGKFRRTRVVVVHPRLVVVNQVPGYKLRVASVQLKRAIAVDTGSSAPMHVFDVQSLIPDKVAFIWSFFSGLFFFPEKSC